MLPKAFLADDLGLQLVQTMADLRRVRETLVATQAAIESQRKRLDALRKRVDRLAARQKLRERKQEHEGQSQQPVDH